jgi:hypothetical protein
LLAEQLRVLPIAEAGMSRLDDGRNAVPLFVWSYFAKCMEARELLPAPFDVNTVEVMIDGVVKVVAKLTPDDLMRMAEVERARITKATLARLGRIDGVT